MSRYNDIPEELAAEVFVTGAGHPFLDDLDLEGDQARLKKILVDTRQDRHHPADLYGLVDEQTDPDSFPRIMRLVVLCLGKWTTLRRKRRTRYVDIDDDGIETACRWSRDD